jgi:hypothetical protein
MLQSGARCIVMTLTVEVSNELEAKLEAEAKRQGLSKDEYVRNLLEEKLNAEPEDGASALPFKPRVIATSLPVKDRSGEDEWLRQHRDEYANQWVALDGDRLIASGDDLKKVARTARALGVPDALMIRVEASDALPFAGF